MVTREQEETFNHQENSNRWLYEIRNMTKMIQNDDYTGNDRNLKVMLMVMEIIESARIAAGIQFPGDVVEH